MERPPERKAPSPLINTTLLFGFLALAEIAKEKFQKGEGKKKYEGFTYEKMQPHPISANKEKVEKIIKTISITLN